MDKLHDIAINWVRLWLLFVVVVVVVTIRAKQVRSDKALDKVVSPSKEGCRACEYAFAFVWFGDILFF